MSESAAPIPAWWKVAWYCDLVSKGQPMSETFLQAVELIAVEVVQAVTKSASGTDIRFRDGIHEKTKSRTAGGRGRGRRGGVTMIPDPKGDHFTVEYWHPKKRQWYTFHYYVNQLEDGSYTKNTSPVVAPNPEIYPGGTKEPFSKNQNLRRSRKVWQ